MPNGDALKRSTEGSRPGKRGRPPGSRNKSRSLVPMGVGKRLLEHMAAQLSPDQFEYLKGVVVDGKPIDTKNEIDTLISLLTRNLYPAIIAEMLPEEEGGVGGVYRKDVTERIKLVLGLLNLRHQKDKNDDPDTAKPDTILTITAKRGFSPERLGILIGNESVSLDRSANGVGGQANDPRALPDTLPERPLNDESGEQGETDWVLDSDSDRGSARGDDESSVQG